MLLQLAPPAWTLNEAALRAAFTRRTRLLVLNTPHNPSGGCLWSSPPALPRLAVVFPCLVSSCLVSKRGIMAASSAVIACALQAKSLPGQHCWTDLACSPMA